jgi:GT2 family glycosyltransferase
VAVVNHRSYRDLEGCLNSVALQTRAAGQVLVVDHDSDPAQLEALRKHHPAVRWEARPNRGFAAGANLAVEILLESTPQTEFLLLLNPDVRLEPEFAERLLAAMAPCDRVAIASGKLLRGPDEGIIDSAGIVLPRHRRPRDRGSETPDRGQYDRTQFIFGASGAALMLRLAAVSDLALEGELFDEDFFMYHEDTDLCWRANVLGWRVLYVSSAVAVHRRGWQRRRRSQIDPRIRRHSFKNHYLQLIKNERPRDFVTNLPVIALWELMRFGYALLRDRTLLRGYPEAARLAGRAWHKRRILQARARARRRSLP